MDNLLSFLSRIQKTTLRTAPYTARATWATGSRSPYKVIMISALIRGLKKGQFKNGIVTLNSIRPHYEHIASILMPRAAVSDPMVVQPFWYLGAGQPKVWSLIPAEGSADELVKAVINRKQIKTLGILSGMISGAEISTADYELLNDPLCSRTIARFIAGEYLSEHPNYKEFVSTIS